MLFKLLTLEHEETMILENIKDNSPNDAASYSIHSLEYEHFILFIEELCVRFGPNFQHLISVTISNTIAPHIHGKTPAYSTVIIVLVHV
jgi:hypothetical protein